MKKSELDASSETTASSPKARPDHGSSRETLSVAAGFSVGTVVHTKEGPRPIETLRVGDWVLSKHESGKGERDFKRVIGTFAHESLVVRWMHIGGKQNDGYSRYCVLNVTPEALIWVDGKGWRPSEKIKGYQTFVEILNPEFAPTIGERGMPMPDGFGFINEDKWQRIGDNIPLFAAGPEDVAWSPGSSARSDLQCLGSHMHIPSMQVLGERQNAPFWPKKGQPRIKREDVLFRTTAHNLEVEHFHTFYAGNMGVWVADQVRRTKNKAPSSTTKSDLA